jgi:hypothetical protein
VQRACNSIDASSSDSANEHREHVREREPNFYRAPEPRTETVEPSEAPAASVPKVVELEPPASRNIYKAGIQASFLNKFHWQLEVVPIVIMLIAVGGWIRDGHGPLPVRNPVIPKVIPAKLQLPLTSRIDKPPNARRERKHEPRKSAFKRKRIGRDKVDYETDDVTTRQFGPIPAPKEPRSRKEQDVPDFDLCLRCSSRCSRKLLQRLWSLSPFSAFADLMPGHPAGPTAPNTT